MVFVPILLIYASWGIVRVINVLFGDVFIISEIVNNQYLMLLDSFTALMFLLYPIEILRPHYLKFRNVFKIALPLLVVVLQVIISNNLKTV